MKIKDQLTLTATQEIFETIIPTIQKELAKLGIKHISYDAEYIEFEKDRKMYKLVLRELKSDQKKKPTNKAVKNDSVLSKFLE
jgi:spore germination protein YaaH